MKFVGKDGKPYSIFVDKITYYRGFVESKSSMDDTPSLKTAVYLVGSTKMLLFPISYEEFDKKIDRFVEAL